MLLKSSPAGSRDMADIELLNKAIESFNSASSTLMQYYSTLEDKVRLLTEEVDHKKQLLDSILDSIDIGVVFFDKDSVIRLVNSACENMLNIKSADVIGGTSIHASIDNEMITPEKGTPFHAIVSRSEVKDKAGSIIGHVLIFKDITRLKELESENERNRRLTAMGELVLKIAHEIRNPLGSIELFASLLSSDLKGSKHGEYANRISNSVRSLVNTLDNMLRFSKGITPKMELCRLNDVIKEIYGEFKDLFADSRISLNLVESGEQRLYCDKALIRQAFINILLNSYQAIHDTGCIEIRIEDLEDENAAAVVVKDTGTGMDEGTMSKIFEPFFSTKDRGTGLGMSIAAGVVSAHGGRIDIKSEFGKGTEFVLILPKGKAPDFNS